MYIFRLDDASEYMDVDKWRRVESILDKYSIKPIVGIIPNNKDKDLIDKYSLNPDFWEEARGWQKKGWAIALHGYTHVYRTFSGGINPVNSRSEFAGVPLNDQEGKISKGLKILERERLYPEIFFAPSHTFDINTLKALKSKTNIRVISDTIANNIYKMDDFYFIPQQSGKVRKLPMKIVTFCYHPNNMVDKDFEVLERFIRRNINQIISYDQLRFPNRKIGYYDRFLRNSYFILRRVKKLVRS